MSAHTPVPPPDTQHGALQLARDAPMLFITRKWAPAMGGMETWSVKVAEHLSQIETIDLVALAGRKNGMPPRLWSLLWFPLTVLIHLLRRGTAPATVLLGDMALWPLALLAKLKSRTSRILIAAHGTDVSYQRRGGAKGRLYGAYLRLGSKLLGTGIVLANSRATAAIARETGWTSSVIIPLATDFCAIEPKTAHNGKILFAGRLVTRKGCGWFVRTVLPQLPPDTILQIAGTGWDPAEEFVLTHPQVEYLGLLDQETLALAYSQAMCVVVPNIEPENGEYEGFGLVAAEAASAGAIVLAADHGGLRDAVIDGRTGMLLGCGKAEIWRNAIQSVQAWSPEKRHQFGKTAQETVREIYNWPRVARDIRAAADQS